MQVQGNQRFLVPTSLGIVLVHGLQKIDPELADPKLRSGMEKRISMIASGELEYSQVLHEELQIYRQKFIDFVARIEKMDELFEASFSPLASSGKPFSKCGKCKR